MSLSVLRGVGGFTVSCVAIRSDREAAGLSARIESADRPPARARMTESARRRIPCPMAPKDVTMGAKHGSWRRDANKPVAVIHV